MAPGEVGDIAMKVLRADLVIDALVRPAKAGLEALHAVDMDHPPDVFADRVIYGFVVARHAFVGCWTLLTKVETSCDRILIAGGANVEAEWEQGPAV